MSRFLRGVRPPEPTAQQTTSLHSYFLKQTFQGTVGDQNVDFFNSF